MVPAALRRWWVIVLLATAGCGGASGPVPVRGTVTLDGQPLANATVQFLAGSPDARDAMGTTDADGAFSLSTFKPGDGALPGKYKVVIQPPAGAVGGSAAASIEEAQKAATRSKSRAPAVTLPPRYTRPDQTVLSQDVPASGKVAFELKSN